MRQEAEQKSAKKCPRETWWPFEATHPYQHGVFSPSFSGNDWSNRAENRLPHWSHTITFLEAVILMSPKGDMLLGWWVHENGIIMFSIIKLQKIQQKGTVAHNGQNTPLRLTLCFHSPQRKTQLCNHRKSHSMGSLPLESPLNSLEEGPIGRTVLPQKEEAFSPSKRRQQNHKVNKPS